MNTRDYIRMAEGSPIHRYYDADRDTQFENQNSTKMEWLKYGKKLLNQLAKQLGLPKGSYKISINAGGPAVSGEAILHGEKIYIELGQGCLGPNWGFMYRECEGRKDFMGKQNRWATWTVLLDLPEFAEKIKAEIHL